MSGAPQDNTDDASPLGDFLQLLAKPEDAAIQLLYDSSDQHNRNSDVKTRLRAVGAALFRQIEATEKGLSGLEELYMGEVDDGVVVDAETLWGQVELQNAALHKRLKRSVRQLSKAASKNSAAAVANTIRLLEDMDDDDEEEEEDHDDGDESHRDSGDDDDDEVDEETKRIRARMERAMEDMEDDDDGSSADSPEPKDDVEKKYEGEDFEMDRDAANLHDGFFNLQEMEAFADEEEEYLPQDAFGEVKPEKEEGVDKRSFHQKQRDGDFKGDSEVDEDDEDAGLLFRNESTVRRRKYREDDEVEALYKLYDEAPNDDGDSDNDVINMTAADLFGKPSEKYFQRWNSKKDKRENADDDSWNDYDFDQAADDVKTGWNDTNNDRDRSGSDNSSDEESKGDGDPAEEDEDESDNEEVSMKGDSKQQKPPTKQAAKILATTEQLEKEMLAEKPWQMTGETGATARPVNSLLDSTPQFEVAGKIAPVITVEHTTNIEEVIKKRILAEDWDDVIPRELPDVGWHKKRGELPEVSQEKSKLGLGELYEREYLKKAVGFDKDAAEKETEEEKAKNEMKTLFANLCSKLDALSNYHFAPRPVADEAEVRTVTQPAIAMEEVLPLHVSDARGVAPEEVYGAKRGRDAIIRADSELDQQERKRLRNSKKAARRKARKAKLADDKLISRLQPGLGLNNPYEKRKAREELSVARAGGKLTAGTADMNNDYGTSSTFFKRMQQEAEQSIQVQKHSLDEKKSSESTKKSSAYKL